MGRRLKASAEQHAGLISLLSRTFTGGLGVKYHCDSTTRTTAGNGNNQFMISAKLCYPQARLAGAVDVVTALLKDFTGERRRLYALYLADFALLTLWPHRLLLRYI